MYFTDPRFGIRCGFDTEETFYVLQKLPGKPEVQILLHPEYAKDLRAQLKDLLDRLERGDVVIT